MDPTQLPALAWFALAARHRSFTKAAAEVGVSRAAVSQTITRLEQQLQTRLLHRTTRDMSLTEAGQQLFEALGPALGSIDGALRALGEAQAEPSGLLRINTARMVAKALIEPHLGEFLARHPQLRLELVMDDGLANIIAEGSDVGIRLGQSLAEHMVAVPITPPVRMAVVASPAYLARHGLPASPDELAQHNCVQYRYVRGGLHRWEFQTPGPGGNAFTLETQGNLTVNDDEAMVRAALQGVGLIQHIDVAVQTHLDEGRLVRVLEAWCPPFAGFHLYAPTREQMPAKVRALVDFLVAKRELMAQAAQAAQARQALGATPSQRLKARRKLDKSS